MISAFERAAQVHARIPREMRESVDPIVHRVGSTALIRDVSDGGVQTLQRRTVGLQNRSDGWSSIATIASTCLQLIPSGPIDCVGGDDGRDAGGHNRISDHETLKKVLASGMWLGNLSVTSEFLGRLSAIRLADQIGYAAPIKNRNDDEIQARIFGAATNVVLMTRADIYHLVNHFIIRDPVATGGAASAYLFDQLWITKPRPYKGVRLIALEVDVGTKPNSEDTRRERLITTDFEVFHASGAWASIDPQRVVYEFMQAAGIFVTRPRRRRYPGPSINDYYCRSESCGRPMIRDELGNGIVEIKGFFVHEECYNRVVDDGEFDYVEYEETSN